MKKRPKKSAITLDPEDVEGAQDKGNNTGDNCIGVEMPFNSPMREVSEGNDTGEPIQRMNAHIKIEAVNHLMPERAFRWIKSCSCTATYLS